MLTKTSLLKTVLIFLILSVSLISQTKNSSDFQYLSPLPNAKYVSPYTNLIIKTGDIFNNDILSKNEYLVVEGSVSGRHSGELLIAKDKKTLIFKPQTRFAYGEKVTVAIAEGIAKLNGVLSEEFTFEFTVSDNDPSEMKSYLSLEKDINTPTEYSFSIEDIKEQEQPFGIKVSENNNPSAGYTFLTLFPIPIRTIGFLVILNNSGKPVYYKKFDNWITDFKPLPNDYLAYYEIGLKKYVIFDRSFNAVDTVHTGNGYVTDLHEIVLLPNGNYLLLSYDGQTVDMSQIVPGGQPDAYVIGLVIQEVNSDKEVVFQWRSWDHMEITDAHDDIDLTADTIDCVHGNALDKDDDGHILLSSRHLDEITKINRQTGDIIWRLGGKNNMFTLNNSTRWFSHQHDIRNLDNGRYSLFDNGFQNTPPYSRGIEYEIDEVNMQVYEHWAYSDGDSAFGPFMGSMRRLPDGNSLIGWGGSFSPAVTEVNPAKQKTLEFLLENGVYSYRAFKKDWKHNFFEISTDFLDFGFVESGDTAAASVKIYNTKDTSITIDSIEHTMDVFEISTELPVTIDAYSYEEIEVHFLPQISSSYGDTLILKVYRTNEMIGKEIVLQGTSDVTGLKEQERSLPDEFTLQQNYPNPFNPSTTIAFGLPEAAEVTLTVFNALGEKVAVLVNKALEAGSYEYSFDAAQLPSGIYFYKLQAGRFGNTKKMILMK